MNLTQAETAIYTKIGQFKHADTVVQIENQPTKNGQPFKAPTNKPWCKVFVEYADIASEDVAVSPVVAALPPTDTPIMSSVNVNSAKVNGVSTVGVACMQSWSIEINNNLSGIKCVGSESLAPTKFLEKRVDITFSANLMFSKTVADWKPFIKSRATMTAEIGLEDSLNNAYAFNFPQLQLDTLDDPDGGGEDDITADGTWTHVKVAPTITRSLA